MTVLGPYGSVSSGEWNPLRSGQQLTSATLAQKQLTVKRLAKEKKERKKERKPGFKRAVYFLFSVTINLISDQEIVEEKAYGVKYPYHRLLQPSFELLSSFLIYTKTTALQAVRSRFPFPMVSLRIFHWHNPSGRTMALGSTQSLTEMSTRNMSWGVKVAGS